MHKCVATHSRIAILLRLCNICCNTLQYKSYLTAHTNLQVSDCPRWPTADPYPPGYLWVLLICSQINIIKCMAYVYNISTEVLVLAMCALLCTLLWLLEWLWTWHLSTSKQACCGGGQREGEVEERWSSPYHCRHCHQVNTVLVNVRACVLWWWSAREGGGGEMGLTTLIVGVIIRRISTMIGQDQ